MKIDSFTISVLENFATIHPSIHIKEGSILETMQPLTKAIKATAVVDTVFPRSFSLYNLWKFISVLNMYKDPDVIFGEDAIKIGGGNRITKLLYSEDGLVDKVPSKKMKLPSVDVTTYIASHAMKDIEKARKVLKVEEVLVVGDGKIVSIQAADSSNPLGDVHSVDLGTTDKTFKAVFRAENLMIMSNDYDVEICRDGIARFKNDRLEYFIAVEDSSEF